MFFMRYIPLMLVVLLFACAKEEAAVVKEKPVVKVVCSTVARRDFVYKVNLLSTLKASDYAITCARATGNLDEVRVVKGTPTVKGETKLFQIDKENAERSAIWPARLPCHSAPNAWASSASTGTRSNDACTSLAGFQEPHTPSSASNKLS